MEFGVGSILEGKVTGITKFGAFVALPGGRSGLVHISEIAYSYVSEVSEFLKEGQEVTGNKRLTRKAPDISECRALFGACGLTADGNCEFFVQSAKNVVTLLSKCGML